jgi:hypothetical protein
MEIGNESQLSLDFEAASKASAGNPTVVGPIPDKPRLVLVHSSDSPQSSSEGMRESRIIESVISHARSLSW